MTDNEKMREDFEKWAVSEGMPITRGHYYDVYASVETRAAYLAWQAAKSVPAAGEPVAYVNADALRKWESSQKDNWSGALLTARPVPGSDAPLYKAQTTSITAAELEQLRKDAERWRKLRAMDWFDSPFCVVRDPKGRISPGSDCPSGTRLDSFIDATEIRIERWPDPSRVREILEKKK